MIFVAGAGFGLYGHLAALVRDGRQVAAPRRYKVLAEARGELASLVPNVLWVDDELAAMRDAQWICLARRPEDNFALAQRLVKERIGGPMILEKPIAATASKASNLEKAFLSRGRVWAVPYLFLYADWYEILANAAERGGQIEVLWTHYQAPNLVSWKTDENAGGGLVAFYFIHCIALAEALLPNCDQRFSVDCTIPEQNVKLLAGGDKALMLRLTLGIEASFEIRVDGKILWHAQSPFGPAPVRGVPDPRIPLLQRFYKSLDSDLGWERAAAFSQIVTARWAQMNP